ncbi:MAG: hypothetical protein ACLR56_15665 [Oscillospiraceae bacterium]
MCALAQRLRQTRRRNNKSGYDARQFFSAECDYSSAERLAAYCRRRRQENTVYTENVRYEFFISDTESKIY